MLATVLAALLSAEPGPVCPPAHQLAGAACVYESPYRNPSAARTGLLRSDLEVLPSADVRRIELGRFLFFDPILSGDQEMSCAHCHQPDLGFGDGRPRGLGKGSTGAGASRAGGKELTRNVPTLWNVAFRKALFWDGRAESVEKQALQPVYNPDEMGNTPAVMLKRLNGNAEYRALFRQSFPASQTITEAMVADALAAFERTLLSYNSPFDRYAAGEADALGDAEKRGLDLFRSLKTRCFECHLLPTFDAPLFKVLGTPDGQGRPMDEGRKKVTGNPLDLASFAVPTVRNIDLTAPYMHSGVFSTLEQVIDFYADGGGTGGDGYALPTINRHVRGFKITPQEKSDLIAFLRALTDESARPAIPQRVPSGLAILANGHLTNP